jgi:hypothetical protein
MDMVYRPVVQRTGSCFSVGQNDSMADANILDDMEEHKNDGEIR